MKKRLVVALVALVAIVGVPMAVAGGPFSPIDGNGVIHGCFDGKAHAHYLKVLDFTGGEHCLKSEHPLNWNQTGPQGPAGPTGSKGDTGPKGATGARGPTGPAGEGSTNHYEPYCRSNSSPREIDPGPCTAVQLQTGWFNVHIDQIYG